MRLNDIPCVLSDYASTGSLAVDCKLVEVEVITLAFERELSLVATLQVCTALEH